MIKWYDKKFINQLERHQRRSMIAACEFLLNYIKTSFGSGASGYIPYKRGKNVHWSSVPGEPPNVDTGILRNSIDYEIIKDRNGVFGRVGTNQRYGLWLEKGTDKMAARPYLKSAVSKNVGKLRKILTQK